MTLWANAWWSLKSSSKCTMGPSSPIQCYTWMWLMQLTFQFIWNVNLWSNSDACTLWLCWWCEDVRPLCNYIRQCFHLDSDVDVDPINLGDLCITPVMFLDFQAHSIQPYVIHQQVSQAMVTPALIPLHLSFQRQVTSWTDFLTLHRSLTWLMQMQLHLNWELGCYCPSQKRPGCPLTASWTLSLFSESMYSSGPWSLT